MKRRSWVALAGGLGNQLYQYAFSISDIGDKQTSVLECVGFKLGGSDILMPEIAKFNIPRSSLVTKNWTISLVERLSFNYLLRASARKSVLRFLDPAQLAAYLIVLPRISCVYYSRRRDLGNYDISYSLFLRVGYFQNVTISSGAIAIMQEMTLVDSSSNVTRYLGYSALESPLVIHVRRGDYLQDKKIGCLSRNYYQKALAEIWDADRHKRIWLFSDDIDSALRLFDQKHLDRVRVIDPTLSAAETFEIMRLGVDYIIANSSFSYWAARLRKDEKARVYSPNPWFKKAHFLTRNTPDEWIIREADFESY